MELKFFDNNKDKLILLLTGWGCDYRQFEPLIPATTDYDILVGFDYSNLRFDFSFSTYKEINLITFSAGVYVAGLIDLPKLNRKIAINGNPLAYDLYYGLSSDVQSKFAGISAKNIIEFRRECLVANDDELRLINKYQPHRSLKSCLTELEQLRGYYSSNINPLEYDLVWLSENDKVFSLEKQKEYFTNTKINIIPKAGHFPFFRFGSLSELLE